MWRKAPAVFAQIVFLGASALCQNLVDINTASEQEIAALPRIGKALAKKIIDQRPYASIDDLARAGVPSATRKLLKSKATASRTQDEKPKYQGGHIADSGVKAAPMEEAVAPPVVAETRNAEETRQREVEAARARSTAQEAQANAERERARAEASSATRAVEQARAAAEQARSSAVAERQMSAEADRQRIRAQEAQLRQQLLNQLNSILQTHDTARGLIVNLPDVLFDTGLYALKPGAREKLAKISGLILAYPGLKISIEGHTDGVGSDDYNRKLSENRATAVLDFLTTQGVPPSSLTAQGFGKNDPIADNSTAAGRQQNRRVDLVVSGVVLGTPHPH